MDNASKALIMAGAILISLALVGLGVYIYSLAGSYGDIASSTLGAAEAEMANKQISSYAGNKVKGSTVKAFVDKVTILNAQETFPIELEGASDSTVNHKTATTVSAIKTNALYTIVLSDTKPAGSLDGYLDTYKITANAGTPTT